MLRKLSNRKLLATQGNLSRTPKLARHKTTGFTEFDRKNRHLLNGLNKYLLDLNIASCDTAIDRKIRVSCYVKQGSINIAAGLVWLLVLVSQILDSPQGGVGREAKRNSEAF